jgi:uncharacterized protein YjiS (DUF1127 family)
MLAFSDRASTNFLRQLCRLVFGWPARIRDYRHLTELGIRRDEIEREHMRSFWRVEH